MSNAHLRKGSTEPPKVEGLLRLYSMKFCPFVQRVRLVLAAKGIKYDTVNINLIEKPEWYFKIHPEGKVPALDIGSRIIVESLDIANYLEENYPDVSLYPSDPEAKKADKEMIEKIDPITSLFSKCIYGLEKKSAADWLVEFRPHLDAFERELTKRGTIFFGGSSPGMVDYMLWPWAERAGVIVLALKENLPLGDDQFSSLKKWKKEMRKQPAVDAT
ncbi:pyrimidodiazepine synthase-like [Aethina tumida]|uniref:pyrimidodiazepine synthase-like n=1 Tax=Aethina tumida TaxID=116153 RepID=UPI00096B32EB|nr:pyrimidodiazepine synthase-like [Aethina tumida]